MNEATIRHLELVQGVINRMAQVSFILKGWTVTVVVALLAVVANNADWYLMLLGLVPVLVFWGLDAYYLRQERLFRSLYDKIRLDSTESPIPLFSMDASIAKANVAGWWGTLFTPTLLGLYGILSIIIIVAAVLFRVVGN